MTLLIKGGTVVTASDQYVGDVFIDGEKIVAIGSRLTMAADRTIDAASKYVLPGGIDVHTHLDMPFGGTKSADDFESGTIAAAHGGTTTIVDFAIQYKGQTLHHAWDTWMKKADGKAAIDSPAVMLAFQTEDNAMLDEVISIRLPKQQFTEADLKTSVNKIPPSVRLQIRPFVAWNGKVEMDDDEDKF